MEGEEVEFALFTKRLGGPSVLLRGGFDVAQDNADVNHLAVVAAVIFAKPFHIYDLRYTNYESNTKIASIVNRKSKIHPTIMKLHRLLQSSVHNHTLPDLKSHGCPSLGRGRGP